MNLSDDGTGAGTQSCESCHDPASGFADPDDTMPVSDSAFAAGPRRGTRNSPTISYAAFIPPFSKLGAISMGGQFLDGREPRLEEQAQQPFLNPIEMNMADRTAVINAIMAATYADEFRAVFGANVFNDIDDAYVKMSRAIAVFERSDTVSPFTSNFDREAAGSYVFTGPEAAGEQIFINMNCGRCHTNLGVSPVFSNFEYENIGVPFNPFVRVNSMDSSATLVGNSFIDEGLGAITPDPFDDGKFRTPTLRNVELTAPYMQNGVFNTLAEVIDFYNSRNSANAEEIDNVTNVDVGALGMSAQQMLELEAFLNTLTDQ